MQDELYGDVKMVLSKSLVRLVNVWSITTAKVQQALGSDNRRPCWQ